MKTSNESCCPYVSDLERKYLFHNHEANRLRLFGDAKCSSQNAAMAAIYKAALMEHQAHV